MRNGTIATVLAGLGVTFTLLIPRAAQACWSCTGDNECPQGFTCDSSNSCMPTVDCNANSDCGAGMRCVTETATECSGSDSSTCHEINSCAPLWQAGCAVDSDCGDGFSCVENGSLCNSSGCSPLAQCQPKPTDATACNVDSDCPSCWSCLDSSVSGDACVNPGGPEQGTNGTTNGLEIPADGGPAASTPPSTSSAKICRPPYWGLSASYEGLPPAAGSVSGDLCPSLPSTREGSVQFGPKSSSNGGSVRGCSISSTSSNQEGAPLFGLATAFAGLILIARRKREAARS